MAKPVFTILAGGVDITPKIRGGGISMTITDGIGLKSDNLTITIDDKDGIVAPPSTGQSLTALGGYEGRLRNFGEFIVDQVEYAGWPQTIIIQAQSVGAKTMAKARQPKDYRKEEYPTYQKIFEEIAGKAGLELRIASEIGSIAVEYEAQGEEGMLEFLTRLGRKLDAAIAVKAGKLIVVKRGDGRSVSGEGMPVIPVAKGLNILTYSVTDMDKPKHKDVEASWYDRKENKRKTVKEPASDDGPTFLIREPFQNEEEANLAALALAGELQRAEGNASFDIDGEPGATAGALVHVSGVRSRVNGYWLAKTVTHNFSSGGPYTTGLQCEKPTKGAAAGADGYKRTASTTAAPAIAEQPRIGPQ